MAWFPAKRPEPDGERMPGIRIGTRSTDYRPRKSMRLGTMHRLLPE